MKQGDPAICTLDPYSLRTLSVLPTAYARISVLYPYSLRRLGGDPHPNLIGGESTDAVNRVRMPAESSRREYAASTD